MPEQRDDERKVAPAAAGQAPERFTRRIDCAASTAADRAQQAGGRGTGRLREPGAGRPDSER